MHTIYIHIHTHTYKTHTRHIHTNKCTAIARFDATTHIHTHEYTHIPIHVKSTHLHAYTYTHMHIYTQKHTHAHPLQVDASGFVKKFLFGYGFDRKLHAVQRGVPLEKVWVWVWVWNWWMYVDVYTYVCMCESLCMCVTHVVCGIFLFFSSSSLLPLYHVPQDTISHYYVLLIQDSHHTTPPPHTHTCPFLPFPRHRHPHFLMPSCFRKSKIVWVDVSSSSSQEVHHWQSILKSFSRLPCAAQWCRGMV